MTLDLPSPEALSDAPELAILAALENTLDLSAHALLAAHPELLRGDIALISPDASIRVVLADALLSWVSATGSAIARYRAYLQDASNLVRSNDF